MLISVIGLKRFTWVKENYICYKSHPIKNETFALAQ